MQFSETVWKEETKIPAENARKRETAPTAEAENESTEGDLCFNFFLTIMCVCPVLKTFYSAVQ